MDFASDSLQHAFQMFAQSAIGAPTMTHSVFFLSGQLCERFSEIWDIENRIVTEGSRACGSFKNLTFGSSLDPMQGPGLSVIAKDLSTSGHVVGEAGGYDDGQTGHEYGVSFRHGETAHFF